MRVACVQMCSGTDIAQNIKTASQLIQAAAKAGAQLIATPEMTHILQRSSRELMAAIHHENSDPGLQAFTDLSRQLGIYFLIGSLAVKTDDGRAANRSFLIGPDGKIINRYDKIHMFDVTISAKESWRESRVYEAGNRLAMSQIDQISLGQTICYDLRFPDLFRTYAQNGAHIITVPAAFTKPTGEAHWHTLLKARAIETGCFILAPAQGGRHEDGRETFGHSLIIGPWGDIRAELDHDEPDYILADIDLNDVKSVRQKIPAWNVNQAYQL